MFIFFNELRASELSSPSFTSKALDCECALPLSRCVIIRIAAVFVGLLAGGIGIIKLLQGEFTGEEIGAICFGALFIFFGITGKKGKSLIN